MENVIIIAIVIAVIMAISLYLYKAKKNGQHCIGCPYSKQCGSAGCSCSQKPEENK